MNWKSILVTAAIAIAAMAVVFRVAALRGVVIPEAK